MNGLMLVPSSDPGQTLTVTSTERTLLAMNASIQNNLTNWAIVVPDGGAIRMWFNGGSPALSATSGIPIPDGSFIFLSRADWQTAKFWAASNTRLQVVYGLRWGFPQGLSI